MENIKMENNGMEKLKLLIEAKNFKGKLGKEYGGMVLEKLKTLKVNSEMERNGQDMEKRDMENIMLSLKKEKLIVINKKLN